MAPATPTPAQPPEAPTTGVAFSPQRLNSVSEEGAAPALGASKVAVVQTGALSAGARVGWSRSRRRRSWLGLGYEGREVWGWGQGLV